MDKVRIRIVKGTYGYNEGKIVSPKKRGDTVDVDVAKAKRLVEIGVAELVGDVGVFDAEERIVVAPPNEEQDSNDDSVVTDGDAEEDEEEDAEEGLELSEEGLNKLTIAELTNLAKDMEIDVAKCKLKSDFVKAILTAIENGAIPEIAPPVIPE